MPQTVSKFPETMKVSALDVKHDEWKAHSETWLSLRILFKGGDEIKKHGSRFLKMRPKEQSTVYAARLDRMTYQNILGSAIGWYVAFMFNEKMNVRFFSKEGEGVEVQEFYDKFLSNVDRNGSSPERYFKSVFRDLCVYGRSVTVIDKPVDDGDPGSLTLAEANMKGLNEAFLVGKTPLEMTNWAMDESGKLLWAVIRSSEKKVDFFEGKSKLVVRWTFYDKFDFAVYEVELEDRPWSSLVDLTGEGKFATLVRSNPHPLSKHGEVPVLLSKVEDDFWIGNRSMLTLLSHLNNDNALDWALFMSAMAMPVIIGPSEPAVNQSEAGYYYLPEGSTYAWTEPEGNSFKHLADRVESLREEAYREMYLMAQGRSMSATPSMQSGRSKKVDMMPARDIAGNMGACVKDYADKVMRAVVRSLGQEDRMDVEVQGFEFFETMSQEEVVAVRDTLNLKIPSATLEKHIETEVARMWTVNAPRGTFERSKKEIEAAPTREERGVDKEKEEGSKSGEKDSKGVTKDPVVSEIAQDVI